ncbi:unnamed protein product [Ectocarpus sp. 12 AP-2014]
MVLLAPLLVFTSIPCMGLIDFFFWRKRRKAIYGVGVLDTTQALGSRQALGSSLVMPRGFDRIFENQFKTHKTL